MMKDNPYVIPILFAGTLEVVAFIIVKYLWPTDDNTVILGGITLALGQVISFLVNSAQAGLATQRADTATNRAETASTTAEAARVQVSNVSTQVQDVHDKASESQITSRTGLSALVKSEDLIEFDRLADGFAKTTLTYQETVRFVELLEARLQDDLTTQQLTAAKRIIEIARAEMKTDAIHDKQYVPQSEEDRLLSHKIQTAAETQQRNEGARKMESGQTASIGPVVEAAKKALELAEETRAAAKDTVIILNKEIEQERGNKK